MLRRQMQLDFSGIKTYSAEDRHNLVTIDNMMTPGVTPHEEFVYDGFDELVERIVKARKNGHPVIWSMGAHVVKNRLSRYVIELMKMGVITHIAANGATSIHDFELAYLGGTSEDVPTAIEDGSFGMWEQTGAWMNEAIKRGAELDLGYGEALGEYIDIHPEKFPNREDCILWNAYKLDIPATYHIALGTDIIHQHPTCDMGAIGKCSGIDFKKMAYSVSQLDGGVFLNFGSAVIGPEVFLKTLSIARNLGYPTFNNNNRKLRPRAPGQLPLQDRLRGSELLLPPAQEYSQPPDLPRRLGLALRGRPSDNNSHTLRQAQRAALNSFNEG